MASRQQQRHPPSGLLYEGNFDLWLPCIKDLLAKQNLNLAAIENTPTSTDDTKPGPQAWRSAQAADLITSYISPGLMSRLDLQSCCNAPTLMKVLRAIAQPFRLLDLPAELRNVIYEMALQSDKDGTDSPILLGSRRPALCRASKQLQDETLPLHFATTRFYTPFETYNTMSASPWIENLKKRIRNMKPAHVRLIGSLTLRLDIYREPSLINGPGRDASNCRTHDITISYTESSGLSIEGLPEGLTDVSVGAVRAHEREAEDMRKLLDLRGGQAVVLCICMASVMWDFEGRLEIASD